jgi:hypothetical protein
MSITNDGNHTYEIVYGEEHPNYAKLIYKYSHVGCPDVHMEDNCSHASDCALAGMCLNMRDRRTDTSDG